MHKVRMAKPRTVATAVKRAASPQTTPSSSTSTPNPKGNRATRRREGMKDKECRHCHKTGHIESQCWSKHPNLKPKKKLKGERNTKTTEVKTESSGTVGSIEASTSTPIAWKSLSTSAQLGYLRHYPFRDDRVKAFHERTFPTKPRYEDEVSARFANRREHDSSEEEKDTFYDAVEELTTGPNEFVQEENGDGEFDASIIHRRINVVKRGRKRDTIGSHKFGMIAFRCGHPMDECLRYKPHVRYRYRYLDSRQNYKYMRNCKHNREKFRSLAEAICRNESEFWATYLDTECVEAECGVNSVHGEEEATASRDKNMTSLFKESDNQYQIVAKVCGGKTLRVLVDSGSCQSFIDEKWIDDRAIKTRNLPKAKSFDQVSTGKMIALREVETEVETPFGNIPRSSILVSNLLSNDMIIG